MVAPTTTTLLAALRRATSDAHARLERRLALLAAPLDRDRYRRVLEGFWTAIEPLERRFDEGRPALPGLDLDARRRAPALERDLRVLGLDDRALAALPRREWPADASADAWLGWLYVSEGSRLGGQVIARGLDAIGLPDATAFFVGLGPAATARLWRELTERLAARPPEAAAATAAAACDAFARFERALERAGALVA